MSFQTGENTISFLLLFILISLETSFLNAFYTFYYLCLLYYLGLCDFVFSIISLFHKMLGTFNIYFVESSSNLIFHILNTFIRCIYLGNDNHLIVYIPKCLIQNVILLPTSCHCHHSILLLHLRI